MTRELHRELFAALNAAGMDCWRGKAIEVLVPLVLQKAARVALGQLKGPPNHDWDRACCAVATAIMKLDQEPPGDGDELPDQPGHPVYDLTHRKP